ncbi:50S ribosomal protein L6 [Truepera radiovictrix]|uniref:Large ribosomal subunit protein uL6 n=1 Tax=Truepera radiovictrix (strain DSM 17093 / CIP 108686 / LMG 22925 / RQ-24) TaxID=649638 RepID=D7CVF2_TRURR|nr:50S ribosomal protein L6 [Truepera radiovictrix]ADI14180.1 ribosomal protein L6 [Truepera radiovictrix DSM 17093]WMT57261.1 50S ribosomal protein L6 [Truepera radiovictrix]
MSRIGRAPIPLPKGVDVTLGKTSVAVKGPKGQLTVPLNPRLSVKQEDGKLIVERPSDAPRDRAQHGLTRTLIHNAIQGVTEGFTRNLQIQGVGYRCAMRGKNLELQLGFSHPVVFEPPEGITLAAPEPTRITVSGIDKQLVGQVAANIRKVRPPDSYHGKGVRYEGEQVRLKPGKAAAR